MLLGVDQRLLGGLGLDLEGGLTWCFFGKDWHSLLLLQGFLEGALISVLLLGPAMWKNFHC